MTTRPFRAKSPRKQDVRCVTTGPNLSDNHKDSSTLQPPGLASLPVLLVMRPLENFDLNCSQIVKDLKPFADGITREDMNHAAKFGVRYQIIRGRVFRQEECMFPFR